MDTATPRPPIDRPVEPRQPHTAAAPPRKVEYRRSSRWPGLVIAALLGGMIAALLVSSFYEGQSVGERIDDTIAIAGQKMQQGVSDVRAGAGAATDRGREAGSRLAGKLDDVGITAAVKTALAADPKLSALKIDVTTREGVVSLQGPAPDEASRDRAGVLAAAPSGVVRVDNQLAVAGTTPPPAAAAAKPEN
jgi:osmotically-inducible protein OsmY